ncbi:protein kinase [Candidatus Woesearchaeota archaeon]|nr:protein kinase [Candidatus Woesearchaeota archaeon]
MNHQPSRGKFHHNLEERVRELGATVRPGNITTAAQLVNAPRIVQRGGIVPVVHAERIVRDFREKYEQSDRASQVKAQLRQALLAIEPVMGSASDYHSAARMYGSLLSFLTPNTDEVTQHERGGFRTMDLQNHDGNTVQEPPASHVPDNGPLVARREPGPTGTEPNAGSPPWEMTAELAPPPVQQDNAQSLVGRVIAGQYEVRQEIARGGMGAVLRVWNRRLNRESALKVLLAGSFADEEERERFVFEAQAMGPLDHPNIAKVYDAGYDRDAGQMYMVMDLVQGKALVDIIREKGKMPLHKSLKIMSQAARAMEYCHRKGVLHRDLKPHNIMLDDNGNVKIIDFGLARRDDRAQLTQTGQILGTPAFMPPEQAGNSRDVDTLSDVYSLGVTLYNMVTGGLPYSGKTAMAVLSNVCTGEPIPIRDQAKQRNIPLPQDVETIVMKAMDREKSKRYQSALEFAEDIERFLNKEPIMARPYTRVERAVKYCRRHPAKVAGIAGTVLALIGGAVGTKIVVDARHEARVQEELVQAESLQDSGQAQEAIARYNAVLTLDPQNVAALQSIYDIKVDQVRSLIEQAQSRRNRGDVEEWYTEWPEYVRARAVLQDATILHARGVEPAEDLETLEHIIAGTGSIDIKTNPSGAVYAHRIIDNNGVYEVTGQIMLRNHIVKDAAGREVRREVQLVQGDIADTFEVNGRPVLRHEANDVRGQVWLRNVYERNDGRITGHHIEVAEGEVGDTVRVNGTVVLRRQNDRWTIAPDQQVLRYDGHQLIYQPHAEMTWPQRAGIKEPQHLDEDERMRTSGQMVVLQDTPQIVGDFLQYDGDTLVADWQRAGPGQRIVLLDRSQGSLLGTTGSEPLRHDLERGLWLLNIQAEGMRDTRYECLIERNEHEVIRNDREGSVPLRLFSSEEIGPGMVYVPAGQFYFGENRESRWLDGFFIGQYEVTNKEWKEFVDAMREERPNDWEQFVPRWGAAGAGRFQTFWQNGSPPTAALNWPVYGCSREKTSAYLNWINNSTQHNRLVTQEEWQKAGRGVSGRATPWGHRINSYLTSIATTPNRSNTDYLNSAICGSLDRSIYLVFNQSSNVSESTATTDSNGRVIICGGNFLSMPLETDTRYSMLRDQREFLMIYGLRIGRSRTQ